MGIKKRRGYIFVNSLGDHSPCHVHVYYKGKELGRFDIENQRSMSRKLEVKGKLKKALRELGYLKG